MNGVIRELFMQNWRTLKRKAHVVGFDGIPRLKQVGGVEIARQSWRIYVDQKLSIKTLAKKDLVPSTVQARGLEMETDIIAIGKPVIPPKLGIQKSTKDRYRPLEAGISSMHKDGTACTLNAFWTDKPVGGTYGQTIQSSNNHCYALEDKAKVGDEIMNPSPYDGGKLPADKTGKFLFSVPITFDTYACPFRNFVARKLNFLGWGRPVFGENDVDIAFASLSVDFRNKIAREQAGFGSFADPVEGDIVAKCGRTTDKTVGKWESTNMNINVQYSRGVVFMTDIAMANLECAGGDSGSPMYKPMRLPIYNGALFAGSDQGKSFGCKVSNIISRAMELDHIIKLITTTNYHTTLQ